MWQESVYNISIPVYRTETKKQPRNEREGTEMEDKYMFDVRRVSQQIRDARIRKNMTQSNLADELGVSYQAVSNWERGNSLPDISKYEDLCRILGLKLEDLLGGGSNTDAVSKFIDHRKGETSEPMTVEEIESVADLLTPEDLKKTVSGCLDQVSFDLRDAKRLAPFLDKETLDELVENVTLDDLQAVVGLAPFLSQETLISIVERVSAAEGLEMSWLAKIMPFLKKESSDRVVEYLKPEDIKDLAKIAPFLRKRTIVHLLEKVEDDDLKFKTLVKVAPFLGTENLEEILGNMNVTDIDRIEKIAPFISRETLKKWIQSGMESSRGN